MNEYRISQETANLLAIGLYHQIATYIKNEIENNPEEYENFKIKYHAKQKPQTSASKNQRKESSKRHLQ